MASEVGDFRTAQKKPAFTEKATQALPNRVNARFFSVVTTASATSSEVIVKAS